MSSRQQQLDAYAQQLGFPSYFKYRDFLAKQMGYASYSAQRSARSSGVGLRGDDFYNPKYTSLVPQLLESGYTPEAVLRNLPSFFDTATEYAPAVVSWGSYTGGLVGAFTTADAAVDARLAAAVERLSYTQRSASRVNAVRNDALNSLSPLGQSIEKYYGAGGTLEQIYKEGAYRATKDVAYELTAEDRAILEEISASGQQSLQDAVFFGQRQLRQDVPALRTADEKAAQAIADKGVNAIRFSDGRLYGLSEFAKLSINANAARAYNTATILAGQAEWYEVDDGAACGWTSHDDPDAADGSIRSADDCLAWPIAHPNCTRNFTPRPDLNSKNITDELKDLLEKASGVAREHPAALAGLAAASVAAAAVLSNDALQARVAGVALRSYAALYARLSNFAKQWMLNHSVLELPELLDEAGNPLRITPQALLADMRSYADDAAAGRRLPVYVLKALELPVDAPAKVVGDAFEPFNSMALQSLTARMSVTELADALHLQDTAYNAFYDWVQGYTGGNKYLNFTFPKLGGKRGKRRSKRGSFNIGDLLQYNATQTVKEILGSTIKLPGGWTQKLADSELSQVIHNLSLNRNGLLRASFSRDAETGFWTPTFRLVPEGPLRVYTRVNRGVSGNVTSLSAEVRLITKTALNFSSNFNINLRALGLETLSDVRNLTLADFRRMKLDDAKFVSAAADLRFRGFNLFDFTKIFRISLEDAQKLYGIVSQWIVTHAEDRRNQIANLAAEASRSKFTSILGSLAPQSIASLIAQAAERLPFDLPGSIIGTVSDLVTSGIVEPTLDAVNSAIATLMTSGSVAADAPLAQWPVMVEMSDVWQSASEIAQAVGPAVTEISREEGLVFGTRSVVETLKRLRDLGFVEYAAPGEDFKVGMWRLTKAGIKLLRRI